MNRPALEVIDGGRSSDSGWLKELYRRYGGAVYGRCRYLLKDDAAAEDAMQDIFARALVHRDAFRGEASVLTWLMKIATHHCLNELRSARAPWRDRYEDVERLRPEGHGGPEAMERRDAVRRALGRLDVETQQAAVHYFVDEMTLEEVAMLVGRSVPTIRKRLRTFCEASGQALREEHP